MAVYIALLRAINLGGHAKVSMTQLRDMVAALGFGGVQTLLNSGNVVFSGESEATAKLETRLEEQTVKQLGLRTDFIVRTAAEWASILAHNPFADEARRDPSHLLIMFLKSVPAANAVENLQTAAPGREVIRPEGAHLYITYPDGIGRSRLTNTLIEAKLGTRGTGRNWNTVLKLQALAQE
jgi:uncharacterized protein (DUF1697 family)